jgi:hypothetical protein
MRCFDGRVYDMERGWLASDARALCGLWFTSTPSESAVHGSVGVLSSVEILMIPLDQTNV